MTRSLFDSADDDMPAELGGHPRSRGVDHASSVESRSERPTDSLWRECSLDAFMAMSEHEQLDYCARRDDDSARFADNDDDRQWYSERAASYRARMKEM